jgi:hypothetical protein
MPTADLIKVEFPLEKTFDADPPLKFYYDLAKKKADYIERHMAQVSESLIAVESIIERVKNGAEYQYNLTIFLDKKEESSG